MEILIRPSYIYMQKSYNARLDSACARVVKSARFEAPKSRAVWLPIWEPVTPSPTNPAP